MHNLFPKNKESRTISLNSQYIVVFKNPRDVSQTTTLAKQMYPGRVKFVQEAFADATSTPYGYILNRTPPRIYACARPYYRTTVFSMYTCQKVIVVRAASLLIPRCSGGVRRCDVHSLRVHFKQDTPEDIRLRTSILPDDGVQYVYMPKSNSRARCVTPYSTMSLHVTCLYRYKKELRKAQSLKAVLVGELCKAAYDRCDAAEPITHR